MKLALVFPGQASQEVGMGVALRAADRLADALYQRADELTGLPIGALCAAGPLDALTRTEVAQTAVVVTSMAAAHYLEVCLGRRPPAVAVAGHSVGELAAFWWAGALDTDSTLHLVHQRGALMARASAACDGSMVAVLNLGEAALEAICQEASARTGASVQVANLNAPGQVVLSGDRSALALAAELALAAGARRVLPLSVGGPFHSVYMEQAAQAFEAVLAHIVFAYPLVPVVLNTSAAAESDPSLLRRELPAQITQPVRWEDSLRTLARLGCDTFVELGPGQVVSGLIRRTLPGVRVLSAGTPEAVEQVASLIAADESP